MSIIIQRQFLIDAVLTDVTSAVLSDPDGDYGVKRDDSDAVVVADATAMTHVSTGLYSYSFDEPADELTYTYWIEWVYDGVIHHEEHSVTGEPTGRICTLADVKDRLGQSGVEHDTLLNRLIAGIESMFDNELKPRRLILPAADVTEYYTGRGQFLQLRRYPIVAPITSIKEALDYDFDAADALTANTDYRIVNDGLTGILVRIYSLWQGLQDSIQVIYRGGYCAAGITPQEGETALPDDLREVAIEQAVFFFKRRDDLGLSSVSFQGGAIQKFSAMDLLPIVKRVLDNYRLLTV